MTPQERLLRPNVLADEAWDLPALSTALAAQPTEDGETTIFQLGPDRQTRVDVLATMGMVRVTTPRAHLLFIGSKLTLAEDGASITSDYEQLTIRATGEVIFSSLSDISQKVKQQQNEDSNNTSITLQSTPSRTSSPDRQPRQIISGYVASEVHCKQHRRHQTDRSDRTETICEFLCTEHDPQTHKANASTDMIKVSVFQARGAVARLQRQLAEGMLSRGRALTLTGYDKGERTWRDRATGKMTRQRQFTAIVVEPLESTEEL